MVDVTHFGRFSLYRPDPVARPDLAMQIAADFLFARNQEGEDFYDLGKTKMTPGALLICVDKTGLVRAAGVAPDTIFPLPACDLYQITGSAPTTRDAVGQIFDPVAGTFTPRPAPAPPPSLQALEMRQRLTSLGLRASFDAYVASAPADLQEIWEYGTEHRRDGALVMGWLAAGTVTVAEVDGLFGVA